jgi:hypothetical protein
MRTAPSFLLVGALLVASTSLAQPTRRPLRQATDAFADALNRANRASPQCRQGVVGPLQSLTGRVAALSPQSATWRDYQEASQEASQVASTAAWNRCPDAVVDAVERGIDRLDEARGMAWNDRRQDRRDDRDDRRDDRDDRRDDRDDQVFNGFAQLAALRVNVNDRFDNEAAVKVMVPELTLRAMRGQGFYLGARFKSFEGHWSEWVTTQQWTVPQDPFVWRNAFTHYFRYSTLAEEDFANGRFVARVALFDAGGRQLAFREVTFRVPRLPQLPVGPPVVVQPVPAPVVRDCGTGTDIGCGMMRDGFFPMDGATWAGFMRSLQSNPNENLRLETVAAALRQQYVTAVQFGLLLDLFRNENLRMRVAELGAPRLVNPQHALGYAEKFRNANLNAAYTRLILSQPGMGQPVPVQVPPPPPPPMTQPLPPPPPGQAYRDCGTGPQDPGCGMQKNGRWPLDGRAWNGILISLRGQMNELVREQSVQSMLGPQVVTADQLGQLLDLFNNEITRLDVAKFMAPRVVNPLHALQFSTKFRNGLLGQEYTQVMSSQR